MNNEHLKICNSFKPYSALLVTSYCSQHRKDSLCALHVWLDGLCALHAWLDGLCALHVWLDGLCALHAWLDGLCALHAWLDGLCALRAWLDGLCALHAWLDGLCALCAWFCVSRKGGTGEGGWVHPQGDMQMVTARLGSQSAMVGTRWANSCHGCMDRHRKCYSHFVGVSFLEGKAALALSGCMTTESADHCMLVNEWAWSRS